MKLQANMLYLNWFCSYHFLYFCHFVSLWLDQTKRRKRGPPLYKKIKVQCAGRSLALRLCLPPLGPSPAPCSWRCTSQARSGDPWCSSSRSGTPRSPCRRPGRPWERGGLQRRPRHGYRPARMPSPARSRSSAVGWGQGQGPGGGLCT